MRHHIATPELVRGIGVITPPRKPKASQDCFTTGRNARTRSVGIAPGSKASDGPSMLVTYADGSQKVVSLTTPRATPSRKTTTGGARILSERALAYQERHHVKASDLPAIVERYD